MAGKKLRRLSRLRILLAVLAVVLFAAVCFTGGMLCLINHSLAEGPGGPSTETTTEPEEPPSSEDTQPSEEEDSEPNMDIGKVGGDPGTAFPPAKCEHVFVQKVADKYLVSAANCASPAVYHESCSRCGATGKITFTTGEKNPDNHSSLTRGTWELSSAQHWRTCKCAECGYEGEERGPHMWSTTPGADGFVKCTVCGSNKPETPDPETPDPETPDPETPDPETPDPETPNPETPDPETPDPETPNPETPNPETPNPVTPDPVTPDANPAKTSKPNRLAPPMHFALKAVRKLNDVDTMRVLVEDNPNGTEEAIVSQGATVSSDGSATGKLIHFLGLGDESAELEASRTLYLTLLIVSSVLFAANLAVIVICCLYRSAVKGLAGMTDTKLRRLTRLSALLTIPAVILFAAVCFTGGILCFINHSLAEDFGEFSIETTTEPEEAMSSEGEDSARDLDVGKIGGEPAISGTVAPEPPADNAPVCQHVFVQKIADKYLVSAANCSSPAVYHESCSRCGATGTATFSAGEKNPNNHISLTYGKWLMNADEHWRTCTCAVCGYEKTERGPHTWATPEANGVATCTVCGSKKPGTGSTPTDTTTATEPPKDTDPTTATAKTPKPKRFAPTTHFALKPVRKLNAADATGVVAEDNPDGTTVAIVSQGATVSSEGTTAGKLIHLLGLDDEDADLEAGRTLYLTLFLISIVLLAADVVGIVILSGSIRRGRRIASISAVPKTQSLKRGTTGFDFAKVHGQGARRYQQDSHGMTPVMNGEGVFAIVADGMGGLSGGEQVSQQIVMQALNCMADITSGQVKIALPEMLSRVNGAVNKMLGPDGLYKSGSTLVAVLVVRDRLRWISVGDSRIYLYRDGWMNQLTQDHDLLQEWMPDILSGKRSYAEALADPDGRKLTSFIGMGELKHVDSCTSPIRILPGDRIVLMSDGVYNSVPAETMADILRKNPDVQKAAGMLHKAVRAAANPHQDNYTAEILAF